MNRTVPVGLNVPTPHYRALTRIAADKGVQVHTIVEHLISRALSPQGLPRPAAPDLQGADISAEIRRLNADGHTDRAIAQMLGLERDIVCQRRLSMKLPLNPARAKYPPADPDRVRELHAQKLTDVAIAERLGTHPGRVQRMRADVLHLPKNTTAGRNPSTTRNAQGGTTA